MAQKLGPETRILIVDDVDVIATTLGAQLKALGFTRVERARTGAEAVTQIEVGAGGETFGLIFLDLKLPDISGLEVLSKCRALPQMAKTPVLMLTGSIDRDSIMQSLSKGATDYIVKPCSPEILLSKLKRVDAGFRSAP